MTTIVAKFGHFRYNRIPMVIFTSGGILKAKLDDIPSDANGVKTYIDYMLVINKYTLTRQVDKLIPFVLMLNIKF